MKKVLSIATAMMATLVFTGCMSHQSYSQNGTIRMGGSTADGSVYSCEADGMAANNCQNVIIMQQHKSSAHVAPTQRSAEDRARELYCTTNPSHKDCI